MAESCLQQWRKIPYLQMKGSDETFITKVAVVLGQCPVPSCPPEMMGVHKTLPTGCLEWWIEKGPLLLGWKGVDGSTTAREMMQKISDLKKNHKKRGRGHEHDWQHLRQSQGTNSGRRGNIGRDERTEEDQPPRTCEWCETDAPLSLHLRDAESCIQNYRSKYLPYHGGLYAGNERLAILDLGLVLEFCINPTCTTEWGGLARHLRGPCRSFYEGEGASVLSSWKESNDAFVKLKGRRHYVKTLFQAHQGRVQIYTRAMGEMLKIVCTSCRLQGPFLDREAHRMECLGTKGLTNGRHRQLQNHSSS